MNEDREEKSPNDFRLPEGYEELIKTFKYCGTDFFKKRFVATTDENSRKKAFKPLDAMLYNAYKLGHSFFAACDMTSAKKKLCNSKAFGSYSSVEDFCQKVRQKVSSNPSGTHLYEIVQNSKKCKLHTDIEYWIKADSREKALEEGRHRMDTICRSLADYTRVKYGVEPERFYIYESTRFDSKKLKWKNSFHITSPDVVFHCNTEPIKAFFKEFIELYGQDDSAMLIDPSSPGSWIIDMRIYTPNRLWRTMHSSKGDDESDTRINPFFFIHPNPGDLFEESKFVGSLANYYPEFDGDHKVMVQAEKKSPASDQQREKQHSKKRGRQAGDHDMEDLRPHKNPHTRNVKITSILNIDQSKRLKVIEQVTQHVRGLKSTRSEEYDKWTHVMFCLKNIGISWACVTEMRSLFIEFSQKCSSKFDLEAVSNKFDLHNPREENSFSLNALKEWYLQDNPQAVGEELIMYDVMKFEFEKTYFKVLDLHSVVYVNDQRDIMSITESALTYAYKNKYCYVRIEDGEPLSDDDDDGGNDTEEKKKKKPKETVEILDIGTMKVKRTNFVRRWLRDEDMKTYRKLVCEPDPQKPIEPGCYNTWPGIRAESLEPINNPELVYELVEPILNHLAAVVTGKQHLRFLLLWLRQQIVQPSHKSMVAILLQGEQGAGKDIIFDFWREKVLGKAISCQTADPDVIWGRHSTALLNCVFLQYDEACGNDLKPFLNRIKDTVTAPVLNLNPKNAKPILGMPSFVNIIFTTNNYNPIPVEASDRRMVMFKCSSIYRGNRDHFQRLLNHIGQERVARAMYEFLFNLSIRPEEQMLIDEEITVNFQNIRPKTDFFCELKSMNIPIFYKMLSAMCHEPSFVICSASQLLNHCNEWLTPQNYTRKFTTSLIAKEIREFQHKYYEAVKREAFKNDETQEFEETDKKRIMGESGIVKKRNKSACIYHFDWVKIKDVLKDFELFDEDQ